MSATFETITPTKAGFDAARLTAVVEFALASNSDWPESLMAPDGRIWINATMNEPKPWGLPLGPVTPRGGPNGLVLRGGRIVAQWGDVTRNDMTFSVAKSYLALLAGIAFGDGRIDDLDRRLSATGLDDAFSGDQNESITWRHLLTQTSEWEGTLFDRPDVVDHNRVVGLQTAEAPKGTKRALKPPGTHWEYNDVRVNRLALSLMQVLDEELPAVLARRIMAPIGASTTWRWHGYANASVMFRGKRMISVPGGGHWGGGIVVSALDHARVGLLVARDGRWDGRAILPTGWVKRMLAPSVINPGYGFMWWLNTDHVQFRSAPASSCFALGAGSHVIWIDPEHDLVVVLRWIDKTKIAAFIERLLAALA
jgi:CubicO group peptidase (beta-lactamase class C family)